MRRNIDETLLVHLQMRNEKTIDFSQADMYPKFNYTIELKTKLGILLTLIEAEQEQIENEIWHLVIRVMKAGRRG